MRWVDLVDSDIDPLDYRWSGDASCLKDASCAPQTWQATVVPASIVDMADDVPIADAVGRKIDWKDGTDCAGFQTAMPFTGHCRRQAFGERRFSWQGAGDALTAGLGTVVIAS